MFSSGSNNNNLTDTLRDRSIHGPKLETRPQTSANLLALKAKSGAHSKQKAPAGNNSSTKRKGTKRLLSLLQTFLASCLLTIALVYFLQPEQETVMKHEIVQAESQLDDLRISFVNPEWEEQAGGDAILNQYNTTFDPQAHAKDMNVNISGRVFTYVAEPRGALGSSYLSTPKRQAGERSHVGNLGIRPIPNEYGRYHAQDSLEWQGQWQLENPRANIERGSSYLRYLRKKFNHNTKDNLAVRELDQTAISSSLPAASKEDIPILSYQN